MMTKLLAALAALSAGQPAAPDVMLLPPVQPREAPAGSILIEQDTPLRLMVLNEVSTKTTKPGELFVLRVDEPVVVRGVTVIPVGAKAWGEVLSAEASGAAGKAGKLSARLLYVEVGPDRIPLAGEQQSKGEKGTTQVALGALAFGLLAPLALFAPGNNAKLKAGDIFTSYLAGDMLFDPATRRFTAVPQQPAAALTAQTH